MDVEKKGWPLGYKPSPEAAVLIQKSKNARPLKTILAAVGDHAKVLVAAAIGYLIFLWLPLPLALLINGTIWLLIAHAQRGLENLGLHEASHYNWSHRPKLNDILANLFGAFPVFGEVEAYRQAHIPHHLYFGSEEDPETQTYLELAIDDLDHSSGKAYAAGVLRRIPKYALGWWKRIGTSPLTLVRPLAWHSLVYLLPLGTFLGPGVALRLWVIYWVVPLVFFLTPLRFIAESSEHRYRNGTTVFGSTVTNCGRMQRWFIHPHNDWVHGLHHIYPSIPHHQLKRVHSGLLDTDPLSYGIHLCFRIKVVQSMQTLQLSSRVQEAPNCKTQVPKLVFR